MNGIKELGKMKLFIGELPPPFGGVAIKNNLLYKNVYESVGFSMLNLVECKWKPWKIPLIGIKLLVGIYNADQMLVGVGTDRRLRIILKLRELIRGEKGLSTTCVFIMGGTISINLIEDKILKELLLRTHRIYVETNGIQKDLMNSGFKNIKIYPNCRLERGSLRPRMVDNHIKYVFFSRICPEKGVDEIIEAIKDLKIKYTIDFYGEIDSRYKDRFLTFVNNNKNVFYHGVFDSTSEKVYKELNRYDIMLLPSRWANEGVPGALVEAKMSGITAIVSRINYNSEVVINGVEGVLIDRELSYIMSSIDKKTVDNLKRKSYLSRTRYSLEYYVQELQRDILEIE